MKNVVKILTIAVVLAGANVTLTASLCEKLKLDWRASPRLVVIKREAPDPYYLSELAEIKGGGTTRRTIANMAELIASLNSRFEQVKVVSLERQALVEQIDCSLGYRGRPCVSMSTP